MSWYQVEESANILNISVNASKEEIKKAYKKAALLNHPDKGGSHENFTIITKAYEILLNKEDYKEIPVQSFFTNSCMNREQELDIEAEELFDILENLSSFCSSQRPVFQNNNKENYKENNKGNNKDIYYTIRIKITDIWKYTSKNCKIANYMIQLPLYYNHIHFIDNNKSIYIELEDKKTDIFTRKNKWDLEIQYTIELQKLYTDHILKIDLPDDTKECVLWKKEYILHIKDDIIKGFFIYNKGLPKPNGERGKLWVYFIIQLPDTIKNLENIDDMEDIHKKESYTTPEFALYNNLKQHKRKKKIKIDPYIVSTIYR